MKAPDASRPFPRWLRRLGWLSFLLLALVFLGSVGRWWLGRQAHEAVERANAAMPESTRPAMAMVGPRTDAIPVKDLPGLGPLLTRDPSGRELRTLLDRLSALGFGSMVIGDPISLRRMLARFGVTDVESLSETDVAAQLLHRLTEFQPLLDAWRAAVTAGRWDNTGNTAVGSVHHPERDLGNCVARLLRVTAQAQSALGDARGAWESLTLLTLTSQRSLDATRPWGGAASGMLGDALMAAPWGELSDAQLRELPGRLATVDVLGTLPSVVDARHSFRAESSTRPSDPAPNPAGTPLWDWQNPTNSVLAATRALIDTPQRRRDLSDMFAAVERASAAAIDYDARTVRPASERAVLDPTQAIGSDWYSSLYYAPVLGMRAFGVELVWVIAERQMRLDQAAIAAQLELQKRATGTYPTTLPSGVPHDPATGQPYGYRLTPDGDYKLWSRGPDQTDNGGDEKADVVWPRRTKKKASAALASEPTAAPASINN